MVLLLAAIHELPRGGLLGDSGAEVAPDFARCHHTVGLPEGVENVLRVWCASEVADGAYRNRVGGSASE